MQIVERVKAECSSDATPKWVFNPRALGKECQLTGQPLESIGTVNTHPDSPRPKHMPPACAPQILPHLAAGKHLMSSLLATAKTLDLNENY